MKKLTYSAVVLAVVAIAISIVAYRRSETQRDSLRSTGVQTLLQRIDETHELHAGYGVYPPYTQEDPNNHVVSGLSVDILQQIADELGCRIVWHRLNWNTM